MSLLEKFALFEDALKSILEVLEANKEKLDRLLASGIPKKEVQYHDIEELAKLSEPKDNSEEVNMDFKGVTVMNQSDKALLVVKKGYQQWLAMSLIQGGGTGYDNGNVYDIEIKEISPKSGKPTKWIYKKWEPFEVFKN